MHNGYVKAIVCMANIWSWPQVNAFNQRAGIIQAPEPGWLGGVAPVAGDKSGILDGSWQPPMIEKIK